MTARPSLSPPVARTVAYVACLLLMVWANVETPLWADDYCRAVRPGGVGPIPLAASEYLHWTGRFFVSAITYAVMGAASGPASWMFDVANAAVFVALLAQVIALAGLASRSAARGSLAQATDIVVVALLLWWLPRSFGEVALWKTGAIGYLWAVTGELWVLRWALTGSSSGRLWRGAAAFFFATFLEPLSLVVSVLLVLGRAGWPLRWPARPSLTLVCAHLAGTIVLLAAPGNFVRAAGFAPSSAVDRLAGVVANLGSLFDPVWLLAAVLVGLAVFAPAPGPSALEGQAAGQGGPARMAIGVLRAGNGWMFGVLALVYMGCLLGVPRSALAARVSFPASVFLVCYVAALLQMRPEGPRRDRIAAMVVCLMLAAHVAIVVPGVAQLSAISRDWVRRTREQADAPTVVLPIRRVGGRLVYARKYLFFEGITPDAGNFINLCYARAMHIQAVVAR